MSRVASQGRMRQAGLEQLRANTATKQILKGGILH
jgi:hypothetical protein